MNITVRMVRENEDGSADCEVRVDAEGMTLLMQYGFTAVLKEAIENTKLMSHKSNIKRRNVSNMKHKAKKA